MRVRGGELGASAREQGFEMGDFGGEGGGCHCCWIWCYGELMMLVGQGLVSVPVEYDFVGWAVQ